MKEGIRKRLSESIEAASQLAEGLIEVELLHGRDPDAPDAKRRTRPVWFEGEQR